MSTVKLSVLYLLYVSLFYSYRPHRVLHLLTPSCPTRRSSDLAWRFIEIHGALAAPTVIGVLHVDIPRADPRNLSRRAFAVQLHHHWRSADQEGHRRSEEHTSELQSLMRTSYAVFCL